jgi:hypothetical protein
MKWRFEAAQRLPAQPEAVTQQKRGGRVGGHFSAQPDFPSLSVGVMQEQLGTRWCGGPCDPTGKPGFGHFDQSFDAAERFGVRPAQERFMAMA